MRLRHVGTALFFAIAGATSLARAAGSTDPSVAAQSVEYPRIHLDVVPVQSSVVPLLRAELDELGLTVVDGPAGAPSITIHAVLGPHSLEVRITDDATDEVVLRELFSSANGRAMDPRTAVLHTSELLRWHLHYQPPAPTLSAQPPPPSPKSAPPVPVDERSRLRLGVLPLAIYSPGGTQLGLGAELDLSRRWSWFGVRALGGSSLVANRMSVPEGQLQARSAWLGLDSMFAWEPGRRGTSLELGLGGALFTSALRGTADGENAGRDDRLLTFAPAIELRAEQRITRALSLVLASKCLVPLEASRLRVLGRPVGRYGREVLTLGLGLQLTLF